MEPEVIKRRGRKRKRKDGEGADETAKKAVAATRSKVLIGRYVKKEFDESGVFLGKIVSYDSGLYRIDYEDGDCEDLETREVKGFLVGDNEMDDSFYKRKKSLDEYISKKNAKIETVNSVGTAIKVHTNGVKLVNADNVETVRLSNGVELANAEKVENSIRCGAFEVSGAQDEDDSESCSDLSDYEQSRDVAEVEICAVPPPQLPPSSGNFGIPEEHVPHLLSVYGFLRSFSVCLFLSPFGLDEFVGALNSSVPNSLLDAIHVALIRALKSHVEILSSEGSELASNCVRIMDWSLLDSLTWPVFIVQYLTTMRYTEDPEWKEFYVNVLENDYYTLSAGRKLIVLQLLCDDASCSAELRTEIDTREASEVGPDPDGVTVLIDETAPKRGRPRKTSFSNDQEAVKDISKATLLSQTNGDADEDGNGDECRLCGMDGTLLCCDGCPSSYHSRCIGVMKVFIPEGEWYCPECTINRNGPNVTRTTSLRGAEFFGVDPYEQVFLGSSDHLLVMEASRSSELHIRYYSPVDIHNVLHALTSSAEHKSLYSEICKGILQYWEIPEHIFSFSNSIEINKEINIKDGNSPDAINGGNVNCVVEYDSFDKSAAHISENGNCNNKSNTNSVCNLTKIPFCSEQKMYTGSSFKPHVYLNVYIHGDFAASAGASLAILSSEEKSVSQSQPSSSHRKFMSANYTLQAKAFSLVAKRFYWPNYEKKLVEVSRERCGWCLSCKASNISKRGCLLNAAASNAIKGSVKILGSLRPSKNVEGGLGSIATYVMFMEKSLRGLAVGPFLNGIYRNRWRKQVEEAETLGEIKAYLLEFERNVRDIAFSADWIKLVDDTGSETQVNQNAKSVVGSTKKRGPGRPGRKPSVIIAEITDADGKDLSTDFAWWRGGMISKHIFHKGILPQTMTKHAARHGGCEKISGVQYVDGLEVPKRSRQFLWRAAVDMTKTASQLALQVRYLDLHVRWNELVCPEQPLPDGKGPEAEASAFRNARIVDKKISGNKISYGVVFENQKHLSSRVLKKIFEVEETGDKKEKNWFLEAHIPLYLIKEYETRAAEVNLPAGDKQMTKLSRMRKKQLKGSGENIFSFLSQKRDNMGTCFCTFCQLDVSFRMAARCSACQGYCHEQCAVGSTVQTAGQIDFLINCKRCYQKYEVKPQNKFIADSFTSPLQGQQSQHPATVVKSGKQNGHERRLEYSNQSLQKNPLSNHSKISKSGKKNSKRRQLESSERSSEKFPEATNYKGSKKKNGKNRSNICLGLIWKKRNPEDTGIEFRVNNLLLKGHPKGRVLAPVCNLCTQAYNSDLMYILCEKCNHWFHAESAELQESKIPELFGFKCCRCRRIRIPVCPYTDPDTRFKLEAKKAAMAKIHMQKNLESDSDSDSETNYEEQVNDWEIDSTPVFDSDDALNIQEENVQEENILYSFPTVDQVNDDKLEVDFGPGSGPGPKKLPVRRHIKPEKESDIGFEIPAIDDSGNNRNLPEESSSTPIVEWNVSTNGFGDGDDMMFDYADLNYEDMEFEPQTYFSFNELLASDDPPGDMTENVVTPSAPSTDDYNPDQYQMGINYDHQEPMFSVESGLDMVPCRACSQTEPCPDLFCQTCGLWLHQHCSPWGDESSSWEPETGWKCGNCRELV